MRTLLYCHHGLGIGHLMRTVQIARALAQAGEVLVLCGGAVPASLRRRVDVPLHELTALDERQAPPCEVRLAERAAELRRVATAFGPDVLLVEMFPFGRKKLASEILALIETARRDPDTRVVCSLRDILVTRRRDQARFDARAVERLNAHFDALLVHGDPALIELGETLSCHDAIAVPLVYTGYVAAGGAGENRARARSADVVVSVGGGRVGGRLLDAALAAAPSLRAELGLRTRLVAGELARRARGNVVADDVELLDFVPDLAALLARSALSISQCGYNTATDVLVADVPAVFVPYETPSEDEQRRRAERFAARGRAVCLREADLDPAALLQAARAALARPPATGPAIALDGARRTRECIEALACA